MNEHGKIPPQAIDLEEVVLGALMLDQKALTRVEGKLRPESFYLDNHGLIYKAIQALNKNSDPVDILTVTQQLKKDGKLEQVGGAYYIAQLTNRVGSSANILSHAKVIHEKFVAREIISKSSNVIKKAFEDTTDINELTENYYNDASGISALLNSHKANLQHISELAPKAVTDLSARVTQVQSGLLAGIPTPFNAMNKSTGGWKNSDLIILAARPGMGKTALALAYAMSASGDSNCVSFFSLEMSKLRLVDRLLIAGSGVNAEQYRNGYLCNYDQDKVFEYHKELIKENIWVDDSPYCSVDYIQSISRIQKAKGELNMIIIDYLQLAKPALTYRGNREGEVAEISRNLKGLAKELDIPIILLAQLNREVEKRANKKPILADLRESGAIEQDADMVTFMYRPEYYEILELEDGTNTEGLGIVVIAKNREGKLEDIPFRYNESLTQFYEFTKEETNPF